MLDSVNIYSSVAVYVQIENQVQFAIASGELKADDQLPTVHVLAERLKMNPNTVAKAYRDLEVMGYLYTRRGVGVFINKGVDAKCREECHKRITARLYEVTAEAKAAGVTKQDIMTIVKKCTDLDSIPYAEPPRELLALAKGKGQAK